MRLLFRFAGLLGLFSSLAYMVIAFVAAAYSLPGRGTLLMGLIVMGISLWLLFTDPDKLLTRAHPSSAHRKG